MQKRTRNTLLLLAVGVLAIVVVLGADANFGEAVAHAFQIR